MFGTNLDTPVLLFTFLVVATKSAAPTTTMWLEIARVLVLTAYVRT